MNRVVITGMGAVTACGLGTEALWTAARDGRSGVDTVEFPGARQHVRRAAAVKPADLETLWAGARPKLQDQVTAAALAAAREAVAAAGLAGSRLGADCGAVIGSGSGGSDTMDRNIRAYGADPAGRGDPMSIPKTMANAAASWLAIEFGIEGPTLCISTACSSATQSIGLAMQMIRAGLMRRCLAGGTEMALVPSIFRGWELMRVMTAGLCRPFSADRDGMVLGEGAAVLVLESLEAAQARGAAIVAELAGYGTTTDAADLLRPDPAGAAACMRAAIADAGLTADDIAYVNAHGTGTVANDLSETEAMRRVFGDRLAVLPVSSTKPIHGHALGAAGAIEFIVTVRALSEQVAPPTVNFTAVDAKLGIDPVANQARSFRGEAALCNSLAFGGINASLVARRFHA